MQQRTRAERIGIAQDLVCLVVGVVAFEILTAAKVERDGKSTLLGDGDLSDEHGFLSISRRQVVVIVETDLSEHCDAWVGEALEQDALDAVVVEARIVRMDADRDRGVGDG